MKLAFPSREFDDAVAAVCHGSASDEQARALNELLRSHPAARDESILRVELHSRLSSEPDLFAQGNEHKIASQENILPIFYGAGRWGSAVEVPAKDADFYALKNVLHGQLRELFYFATSSNTNRHCFVYTPPDYDKASTKRYPVLYLQHGAGEDETGCGRQGHTGRIMDHLLAEGKAKPFIIVMENGGGIGGGPRRTNAAPAGAGATNAAVGPGGRGGFGGDPKENTAALKAAGVNAVFYQSPNTAHAWQSWRRSLHEIAPLLFKD